MVDQKLLPPDWNAKQEGDRVMARLKNICQSRVIGAHDSDFLIIDGKAYIVYMANDVQPGESPEWDFVYNELSVVDVVSGQVEHTVTFAASEMEYDNDKLARGACFVPRIIRKDDTNLRCFFASEEPGRRQSQTYYIDYDFTRMQFDRRIFPASIETDLGRFPMQPQYLYAQAAAKGFTGEPVMHGLYMIDGFKRFDGKIFAVLNNFPGGQNAWASLNDSMDCFTVLGNLFLPLDAKLTESAVNRLPNGSWIAVSRQENRDKNYMFASSPDGRNWTPHEYRANVTCGTSSKPVFECFERVYYLGWNESTSINNAHRSVFNLDVSRDGTNWERKYRFESDKSFQYPVLREWNGAVYLTVTQGDNSNSRKERIMFGKLEDV